MLKGLLIAAGCLAVVVVAVLVYAATKPATFRVQRTAVIKAPPEKVFALVNDLNGWRAWSPYEKKDPAMKRTHSGAPKGKGAIYAWDGDNNVGAGRMEIIEAVEPKLLVIKLDFLRPFEAHNTGEFAFAPVADGTQVTWAIYGPNLFIGKVMGLFIDMDKMIGKDFEEGLAGLKALAER